MGHFAAPAQKTHDNALSCAKCTYGVLTDAQAAAQNLTQAQQAVMQVPGGLGRQG